MIKTLKLPEFTYANGKLVIKNRRRIIKEFESNGIIKFPNITSSNQCLIDFVDSFSHSYANDATRREKRFDNKKIRNVDAGKQEIFLHSETSFSPSQPEIVWFYCLNSGKKSSGQTIYCDGIDVWERLPPKYKIFFLENPILYKLRIPVDRKLAGKRRKKWYLEYPGVKDCFLNFRNNSIEFDFIKFAVEKSRMANKLSFVNHLLIPLISEPQIIKRSFLNNKKLRKKEIAEISNLAYSLTKEIIWKKYDLVMIDNLRFMHGRRKINSDNNSRDIVTIQTMKSNFGYGSTLP